MNRKDIWNKYNQRCAYCGNPLPFNKMQVDHINPLFRNDTDEQLELMGVIRGLDDESNYNPSCARCNRWKSTFTLEAFRKQIQDSLSRLERDSPNYRLALDYNLININPKPVTFYFELIKQL